VTPIIAGREDEAHASRSPFGSDVSPWLG